MSDNTELNIISKSKYDTDIDLLKKQIERNNKTHESHIESLMLSHKKEIKIVTKELREVLPKLFKVDAEHYLDDQLRVMVTLDKRHIREILQWGNSDKVVDIMAHEIGQKALIEIRRINAFR